MSLLLFFLLSRFPPTKKVLSPRIRTTATAIIAIIAINFKVFSDIEMSVTYNRRKDNKK